MFKRRAASSQHTERRQIGQPQLLHTTYDQKLISTQAGSGLAASSAPSEYFNTPLDQLSSSGSLSYRRFDSTNDIGTVFKAQHHRDNSSVYSQASEDHDDSAVFVKQQSPIIPPPHMLRQASAGTYNHYFPDPPTINTPETTASLTPDANDSKKNYFGTHIPMLRKQKSSETRQISSDTRWDEYKGEPIRSGLGGKPGSVQPKDFERDFASGPSYDVRITGGADKPRKPSWTERAAKMKDTFDSRPPWKGGAGRSAIVDPVKDTSVARSSPKFTAVKNVSRGIQEADSGNSLQLTISAGSGGQRDLSPVSSLGGRYDDQFAAAVRNGSTVSALDEASVSLITTDSRSNNYFKSQQRWEPPPQFQTVEPPTNLIRKPVASLARDSQDATTPQSAVPTEGTGWSHYGQTSASSLTPTARSGGDEPTSRFSWTTVNTATTYQQDSPPPSPPPIPVPSLDKRAWQNVGRSPARSVEKPPTPPPAEHEKVPVPGELPPSKSMDHVEFLIAQEANLVFRHRTILKVVKELEKIASASPMDVDWKTMKANKKNLDEKKEQLAIVEREQHELGLSIARARRKAEREDGIESGLWVRRMGG